MSSANVIPSGIDGGNSGVYKYLLSSEIKWPVRVKIGKLEGKRKKESFLSFADDPYKKHSGLYKNRGSSYLYVTCALYAYGRPLCLKRTAYQTTLSPSEESQSWNEWVSFPLKYQDLPATTEIVITIWDILQPNVAVAVGGTTFPLFSKNRILHTGRYHLDVWVDTEGDGSIVTKTPGKTHVNSELDRLGKIAKRYERGNVPKLEWLDILAFEYEEKLRNRQRDCGDDSKLYLSLEFPTFDFPVFAHEMESVPIIIKDKSISNIKAPVSMPGSNARDIVLTKDPEIVFKDPGSEVMNPVQLKHMKLSRSYRRKMLDKDAKPDTLELKQITNIITYPPTKHLTLDEKELLWKFRYYLTNNKKALSKFLKCIDWGDQQEALQAVDLMNAWQPIDVDESLGLLGPSFKSSEVRRYAVSRLQRTTDEELLNYLLQLVQAIRYENPEDCEITQFLMNRACSNFELANYIYWYIHVEMEDPIYSKLYSTKLKLLTSTLAQLPNGASLVRNLKRQEEVISSLCSMQKNLKTMNVNRPKKIAKLKESLAGKEYGDFVSMEPLPAPLNPKIELTGVMPDKATIFKSAMQPLGLWFQTSEQKEFSVIVKNGDDLRQDQFIIQLITLMDNLLKKENLDLKLTPYRVLATSSKDGLVECITPSRSMASVIKDYDHDIQKYFREVAPSPDGPYGISAEVLDNFVKSCAGYCVITFLLGIGDRHLDNLLLTPTGRLFHIDFGFIWGRDPKPFPPPVKLCKEMVEGMGGANSVHWFKFRQLCCEAYNILRKSSNLILNLLHLMADANIPDISGEPEKSMLKLQEKFRLDLTDEEAVHLVQDLIAESVTALFPVMVEYVHKWAQYWRS